MVKRWLAVAAVAAGVAVWGLLGVGRVAVGTPRAPAPEIRSSRWINSPPLTPDSLRGKVVAVEFWTYG